VWLAKINESVDGPRRDDPLATLSRYLGNFVEVLVIVEDDEARPFRCRCDQEVGNLAAALASTCQETLDLFGTREVISRQVDGNEDVQRAKQCIPLSNVSGRIAHFKVGDRCPRQAASVREGFHNFTHRGLRQSLQYAGVD